MTTNLYVNDSSSFLNSTESDPQRPSWLSFVSTGAKYHVYFEASSVILSIVGVLLNCCIFDVTFHLPQKTSGTKWIRYLSVWDTASLLTNGFFGIGWKLANFNFKVMHFVICKAYSHELWATTLIANSHVVALAIDRATSICFPDWHYPRTWDTIIPRVSWLVALFHHVTLLPTWYFYEIQGNLCLAVSSNTFMLRFFVFFFGFGVNIIGHFVPLIISNVAFVRRLIIRTRNSQHTRECNQRMAAVLATNKPGSSGQQRAAQQGMAKINCNQ